MKNRKVILASVFALLCHSAAQAAGLQASFDNASSLGLANAGSAVLAENATTVVLNPAGMFNLKEREISLGAISIKRKTKFSDQGSSSGAFSGSGGRRWSDEEALYNLYATYAINSDFRFGIGVKQPYKRGGSASQNWVGSAQEQRFEIESNEVTPAIAYKINNKTSIGGGANWQHVDMQFQRASSTLTAFSLNQDSIKFKGSGDGWGWNAGLMHEVNSQFKIGFTYKSRIKYNIDGNMTVSGPTSALLASYRNPAYMQFISPEAWTLSIMNKFNDKLTFVGDASLTKWGSAGTSAFISGSTQVTLDQSLDVNLKDTYRFAAGLLYAVRENLDLKFGYAFEQSPIQNEQSQIASLPEGDIQWLSLGARVKILQSTRVDLGAAYSFRNNSKISNDQRSSNRGAVNGDFNVNSWIFGLQLSQSF